MNGTSISIPSLSEQRVYLIEDDAALRDALDRLLRSVGLQVCAFASAADFLRAQLDDTPSCLVLDVRLPGISGLDFHAKLLAAGVQLPVIFMTGHGDIPMSVQAMKAGAVDFLAKPFRDQDLLDAVSTALEQDRQRRQQASSTQALIKRYDTLTPRERQVMALVCDGLMNKQIAGDMGLSEITVKIHRGHVMKKMNVRTLADLVRASETIKALPPAPP